MFKNVMALGFIQVGIALVVTVILELLKLEFNSYTWPSFLSALIGAQTFAFYQLKRNENFFVQILRSHLSLWIGIFHLVIGAVVGGILAYLVSRDLGGWGNLVGLIETDLGKPITARMVVLFFLIVIAFSYFLSTGITYLGLAMGQKIFVKQKKKLNQNENF